MDEREAKLLEALDRCSTPEEVEVVLADWTSDLENLVRPRQITITYQCCLCSGVRKVKEIVRAKEGINSHTLNVPTCSLCDERLAQWEPAELVRVLMNFVRFGNLRAEHVKWLRIGGDLTKQMMDVGMTRIPLPPASMRVGEGELTYNDPHSDEGEENG